MTMTEERLTPFMLFYCEVRDKVEKESPKLQPHEVSSEIARRWKALPADQSRAYSVLSATYAEQKKFQKDSPKVPPSPKPVKKRKERYKDPRAPKSATSAYMYFSKHHRTLLKRENASLTFGDLGKTVGAMWKAATPGEKKPFEDLAARDRARYARELEEYKKERLAEQEAEVDSDDEPLMKKPAVKEESSSSDDD